MRLLTKATTYPKIGLNGLVELILVHIPSVYPGVIRWTAFLSGLFKSEGVKTKKLGWEKSK